MSIQLKHVCRAFGDLPVVDDVSFEIKPGELVSLLGPSGGGKSTILRIIAGLERADRGEVWLDDQRVDRLHARQRQVGFVFQHYALFKHLDVAGNIGFGLSVRREPAAKIRARVDELVGLMGLKGLEHRYPANLSGGQRQRVALARALAPSPKLLLLDEPFSAVDAKVRQELRQWLRRLHDEVHTTSIFVTHDQEEAFAIADRVLICKDGHIEQAGTPVDILDHPASEFVAQFIGEVNLLDGYRRDGQVYVGPLATPEPADGAATYRVVIRGYDLKFWRSEIGMATVSRVLPMGDRVRVEALLDGGQVLFAQFPRRSSMLAGMERGIRVDVQVSHARTWPIA
jgi:sulfate transport system ATP-binding protein